MIVNNELEKMWKEVVVAQVKILCRHLTIGTEEYLENTGQDSQEVGLEVNRENLGVVYIHVLSKNAAELIWGDCNHLAVPSLKAYSFH